MAVNRHPAHVPLVMFAISAVFIFLSVGIVLRYGPTAYYVCFHRPFHFGLFEPKLVAHTKQLPTFSLADSISQNQLSPGDTQTIRVVVTPHQTSTAKVKVWITNPKHKQIYKNKLTKDSIEKFQAGVERTYTFSYTISAQAPPGSYVASVMLSSPDDYTDYAHDFQFATFNVQ